VQANATEPNNGPLRVRAISGSRVVLMAFDLDEKACQGLHGFAIKRGVKGSATPADWLKALKYFKQLVPNPQKGALYSTRQHPIQSFLWSDYEATPGTTYEITVAALYGDIANLTADQEVTFEIKTEAEDDGRHGIWFNRGAIASHALASEFDNKVVTKEMFSNAVDQNGQITDKQVQWLSRGLAEACLGFINKAKRGEGLRVCAYEFTFPPILDALKRASERRVDVKIIYHYSKKENDTNLKAVEAAGLPDDILIQRTHPAIPHNKFIVKLVGDAPKQVWTGSTNLTDSGFFGQTNVGHLVTDDATAGTYLRYWEELSQDPTEKPAIASAMQLTPNPPNEIGPKSIVEFFSPRVGDNMVEWYGQRIVDAVSMAGITLPFNVAPSVLKALSVSHTGLRLAILEDPPSKEVLLAQKSSKGHLVFSNGAIFGKQFRKIKSPTGGAVITPIPGSKLDEWFLDEELGRPSNAGHVFFIHTKFAMVDPLSDDPLVCTGSANFSTNSLIHNDENMLLIRGDRRVAHIYLTEFDRIFRHFFARDWVNNFAKRGDTNNPLELDPSGDWLGPNFAAGSYKNNRRLLFFPDTPPSTNWADNAAADSDPFDGETERGKELRSRNHGGTVNAQRADNAAAKARQRPPKKGAGVARWPPVKGAAKNKAAAKKMAPAKKAAVATRKAAAKKRAAVKKKQNPAKKSPRREAGKR
jgi:phosphatidylserine/phosphatidylglycerophosphate/cardiolipin synthase-like enzyme